jgi:Uma2 family endonuclease
MITQKSITLQEAAEFSDRMQGFGHFEFASGQIIPVHGIEPVDESMIDYVLSPEFFNKPKTPAFPMATQQHDRLVYTLQMKLGNAAFEAGFIVYSSAIHVYVPMRALVSETEVYRTPDIVLLRKNEEMRNNWHHILNPLVVMEVLSPSTQARDRLDKVEEYQSIDSLQQYFIVWQDRMKVMVYSKIGVSRWEQQTLTAPTENLMVLPGLLGYQLSLSLLYANS